MPDIVTAIQSAIDIVGKLRALSKKIEDAEFKMLLADLSGELADAKLRCVNTTGFPKDVPPTRREYLLKSSLVIWLIPSHMLVTME